MTALSRSGNDAVITEQGLAQLGAARLAHLLLQEAARDPSLLERLRPDLARNPPGAGVSQEKKDRTDDDLIIGDSPVMRRLKAALRKVAATEAPVLVTGESGTGKELAAATIHRLSRRADNPFVAINCAALPPSLIASELFGHEKGAFTGADQRRLGRIEAASGGVLFLDEIGDLPLDLQAHLLRFLQEGTIDRLGGRHTITVDARVVAATNVPLRRAVSQGRFREDLYYRLNVLTVEMPPLRSRGEDIGRLCDFFLTTLARGMNRPVPHLSAEARAAITMHSWPGNVRELMAVLKRALVMAEGDILTPEDLAIESPDTAEPGLIDGNASLGEVRAGAEAALVRDALRRNGFNVTRAAQNLGVSRVTLYRMIERHNIPLRRAG